jgi:hypothetical protein
MIDELIMLLSTDWFLPYWAEIGIDIAEAKKVGIKQGCREIVDQLLGGADDYCLSDFSEARKLETDSRFLALLRLWDAQPEVSATLKEWANLSHQELNAVFACYWINSNLSSVDSTGSASSLEFHIRAEVVKAWELYTLAASNFGDICLRSRTKWDIRTRHFLSSPKALANQLWRVLLDRRLRAFWVNLRERLTPQQIQELVSWYREMFRSTWPGERPDPIPPYIK